MAVGALEFVPGPLTAELPHCARPEVEQLKDVLPFKISRNFL